MKRLWNDAFSNIYFKFSLKANKHIHVYVKMELFCVHGQAVTHITKGLLIGAALHHLLA